MVVRLFRVVTALGLAIQRCVDRPVRQLAEIAGAPDTLRHKAARLEAGRSNEPARKVAGLMRALADDKQRYCRSNVVRDTGIEPVTSSVSGKRSPAELIARGPFWRWRRESNPCARLCRPLPHHSATPPLG
jgi:hypothetical protein